MGKRIWISCLNGEDKKGPQAILQLAQNYGLSGDGHFWQDDITGQGRIGAASELMDKNTGLWVITGRAEDFALPSIRQGLSLLALTAWGQRGSRPSILIVCQDELQNLPFVLSQAAVVRPDNTGLGAKLAAKANIPSKKLQTPYRLKLYPVPRLGLWVEVGPKQQAWDGVLVGAEGGKPNALGVGQKDEIPQSSVLEYPLRGLKLEVVDREFTAWSARNNIDPDHSAFVHFKEAPQALVFGEFRAQDSPEQDFSEMYVLNLI